MLFDLKGERMKISELKKGLAIILEVPEDPERVIMERVRKREFLNQGSQIIRDIFARAFILEGIWGEFQTALEKQGRELTEEVTISDLNLFRSLTKKFFSQVRIHKTHYRLREKISQDRVKFLEAIEILEREILKG